jgi:7-cyano-7-deazaguanine tRNA-ribosyltransferase
MGYEAVMTNAYTTFSKIGDAGGRTIQDIIDFDGSVMTDSGGYQLLEFGTVDVSAEEIAKYQEKIGSDIAIILDKPTGLDVSRSFARDTVVQTLERAKATKKVILRNDMLWTVPVQGGKYLDLVRRSAKESSKLGYDLFALGSPVEVMEEYDFPLLVGMILSAKKYLPPEKPFHLFGAGHPLILPLAVGLGCDMFDSASYMLYAKNDRYILNSGTIRLEQLEYLSCPCSVCSAFKARELQSLVKTERVSVLARHNLAVLLQCVREIKQAIWEGRLWELIAASSRKHPRVYDAFKLAISGEKNSLENSVGSPRFRERGVFLLDDFDLKRPELRRHFIFLQNVDLRDKQRLVILPETKTKPFLRSDIFEEVSRIVASRSDSEDVLVVYGCPNYGLVPAEISDIYPLSQTMSSIRSYPKADLILNSKAWSSISLLLPDAGADKWRPWITSELASYFGVKEKQIKISEKERHIGKRKKTRLVGARSYRSFKQILAEF